MKKRIKVSQVALYGILTLISVLWIIPVLFIFSLSVTPETSLSEVGYRLIPKSRLMHIHISSKIRHRF